MVPDGWKVRKLSEVAYIQTGIAKGKKGIADPIKLPYLRVANVQDGYLDLCRAMNYLTVATDWTLDKSLKIFQ